MHAPTYAHAYSWLTGWAALTFAVVFGFARLSYGLLLPALRADLHGSYSAFGRVASANLAGYLLGTITVPFVVTRIRGVRGTIWLNTIAILVASLAMAASALSTDLIQLGIWRFISGAFSAPATVLTLVLTLERVVPRERGRASGVVWMGMGVGIVLSGLIAPLVIGAGTASLWRLVWMAMGIVGIAAAWGLHRALRIGTRSDMHAAPPSTANIDRTGASEHAMLGATLKLLLQPRGLLTLTLAYFVFGCGYIIYFTYFIALATHQGVPAPLAGLVWSILGAAGIAGGVLWGRAIDRWPTGLILAIALSLGAVGALAVQGLAVEALGAILVGTTIGGPALVTILLRQAVPAAYYTASLSLMTTAVGLGQVVGPIIGGAVVDAHGLALGTATTAIALTVAALLAASYGAVQQQQRRQRHVGIERK